MLEKLQKRWKVNGLQLLLILCTFAIGGSACGFLGKKVMNLLDIEKGFWWFVLYITIVTILWPMCVIIVSIPFGQFKFFKKYLTHMFNRMRGKKHQEF